MPNSGVGKSSGTKLRHAAQVRRNRVDGQITITGAADNDLNHESVVFKFESIL